MEPNCSCIYFLKRTFDHFLVNNIISVKFNASKNRIRCFVIHFLSDCKDDEKYRIECAYWAKENHCKRSSLSYKWMQTHCPMSCNLCKSCSIRSVRLPQPPTDRSVLPIRPTKADIITSATSTTMETSIEVTTLTSNNGKPLLLCWHQEELV